jgi:hypothetical protein
MGCCAVLSICMSVNFRVDKIEEEEEEKILVNEDLR